MNQTLSVLTILLVFISHHKILNIRPLSYGRRNIVPHDFLTRTPLKNNATVSPIILSLFQTSSKLDPDETFTKSYFENIEMYYDLYERDEKYKDGKICESKLTKQDIVYTTTFYDQLKETFDKNCSYILGNLVIAHMDNENLSFLNSIKEVSGFVLLFGNTAHTITLKNLRVIRGENPFVKGTLKVSLFVGDNYNGRRNLKFLNMPNLEVILRHHVAFINNPGLCHVPHTVNWESLTHYPQKIVISEEDSCYSIKTSGNEIKCHTSCKPINNGYRFCWTNSSDGCQKINDCSKRNCRVQDNTNILFTPKCYYDKLSYVNESCCHDQCAGGCKGPLSRDCTACRNFNNDGTCVEYCPSILKYDQFQYVPNPNGRLTFHNMCVKKCPEKFYKEKGHCVAKCSSQNSYIVNKTCTKCPHDICPKICLSREIMKDGRVNYLHRLLLDKLENCTVYDDNIIINQLSINGDQYYNLDKETYGIRLKDLKKLEKLTEVYGSVDINTVDAAPWLRSLSFLKNLKIIRGGMLKSGDRRGLYIRNNHYLLFLGLINLKIVQGGYLVINRNPRLMFMNKFSVKHLLKRGMYFVADNGKAKRRNYECDPTCDLRFGCWGPGRGMCVKCKKYFISDKHLCTDECSQEMGYFSPGRGKNGTVSISNKICLKCNLECRLSDNTCHGPRSNQCNNGCRKYKYHERCVPHCPSNFFADVNGNCQICHSSCSANIKSQYSENKERREAICYGPDNIVGPNGCKLCHKVAFGNPIGDTSYNTTLQLMCMHSDEYCSVGTFLWSIYSPSIINSKNFPIYLTNSPIVLQLLSTLIKWTNEGTHHISVCLPCHPLCYSCKDGFSGKCNKCRYYESEGNCVEKCSKDQYIVEYKANNNKTLNETIINPNKCLPCHEECDGSCRGPLTTDCNKCRHVKIYINQSNNEFMCNSTCGDLIEVSQNLEIVCLGHYPGVLHWVKSNQWLLIIVLILIVILVVFVGAACYLCRSSKNRKKIKYIDIFNKPNSENNCGTLPNMAKLLLITESQITRGEVIGSGAFGKVYKGYWKPNIDQLSESNTAIRNYFNRLASMIGSNEEVKILVAVKLLNDISDPSNNKELLQEAKVMASVEHPCCLRVLAVCLTSQPQLVTQFMPLGCLLEFCQRHKRLLTNQCLLAWCVQIASGMSYLESRGIVHCDLAARNVLVQSPKQVKITDFGLAKILDQSQQKFQSKGGKMPIKWLALECIRNRLFSSKSDVWSYGVTLWEIFTFGDKPYSNIRAMDMLRYLEQGQRLPQPTICSIDVYALMIQCWLIDPEGRPCFTELCDIFEKMSEDPSRYLLLQTPTDTEDSSMNTFNTDCDTWSKYSCTDKYDEFLQALTNGSTLYGGGDTKMSYDSSMMNSIVEDSTIQRQPPAKRNAPRERRSIPDKSRIPGNNKRHLNKTLSVDTDYTSLVFDDEIQFQKACLSSRWKPDKCSSKNPLYINTNYQYLSNLSPMLDNDENDNDVNNNNNSTDQPINSLTEDGYLIPCTLIDSKPDEGVISLSSVHKPTTNNFKLPLISSEIIPAQETNVNVIYACENETRQSLLIDHESSL